MAIAADPNSDPTTEKPPRPRRRIPLSLRIFVVMLGLLLVSGVVWIGVPACREHLAIREIEWIGGQGFLQRTGPDWLRNLIGDDRMRCLDEVELVRFRPDEKTFRRRHKGIYAGQIPYTTGPTVDDATIACVMGIPKLKRLGLGWTNVTDASMKHISQLHDLTELSLHDTDVSDAGLESVSQLRNLRSLDLEGTNVSDAGATFLVRLTKLETLHIGQSKVTDSGLVHLKALTRLEQLGLDCRQLTPAGIQRLTKIPNLKFIHLNEEGCEDFRLFKRLRDELRRALPGVEFL